MSVGRPTSGENTDRSFIVVAGRWSLSFKLPKLEDQNQNHRPRTELPISWIAVTRKESPPNLYLDERKQTD
jgi:hypothetical protein